MTSIIDKLAKALANLNALVWGECPSLLNEDSGGNSTLALEIEEVLSAYRQHTGAAPAVERGVAEEREAFEADRKLLGWASKADENGVPLLARHEHGTTWWGSENTMPTYRCQWTEAQWLGWLARAALSTTGKETDK